MLIYEEPRDEAGAKVMLDDLCIEADHIMFPATRGEKRGLRPKRRKVNSYFQRFIAYCFRNGWKDLANDAKNSVLKMNAMKEAVQDMEEIY